MSGNHQKENQLIEFNSITEAIEDIRAGKLIIVVDDDDRENEGDFVCAASSITPEIVNFMARYGRGLICAPICEERARTLQLQMMVDTNSALHETAFTISIDYNKKGCTTGISAYDRATCIKALVDPDAKAQDFARPGHIFPLIAKTGGVLRRTGHTEAAIDLARMAGFEPAGVLVEILNEDGSMARTKELVEIAKIHGLKIISIKDLVAYRMQRESIVERVFNKRLNTKYGQFEVTAFKQSTTGDVHLALSKGSFDPERPTLTKVQASTATLDILYTLCSNDLDRIEMALNKINKEGEGILLIMRHSDRDRNIDFLDALKNLGDDGAVEKTDAGTTQSQRERDIGVGSQILRSMGIKKMRLLTNNVAKHIALEGYGLEIVEYVPLND